VIQGFITGVTLTDGELVDIAYEPSENSARWSLYQQRAAQVRMLRGVASSASQQGQFRLAREDADKVGRAMQIEKGIDPTLAVYATYAYHDLQEIDRIRDMSGYLKADVGVTFFDLELLGRRLIGKAVDRSQRVLPFVPLLSQGWPLLSAHRVKLHPALEGIERTMRPSLWSLFDSRGFDQLARAMATKEVL
jgi:hypothetical protein